METTPLDKAKAAYPTATAQERSLLESLFGKQPFEDKIIARIKTFEDACKMLGLKNSTIMLISDVASVLDNDTRSIEAYSKLIIVTRALNEGWVPDWANSSQIKYYPLFDMRKTSGLSYYDCDFANSRTSVGSRLCLKSAELAKYIGTQFADLYKDFFII